MGRRPSTTLTQVELEFMRALWSLGEATTDDVMDALRKQDRELSDGSIRKVLSILMEKGYVSRKRRGRGFLYRAKVREGQANRRLVQDLLKRAFGGSAALMVASIMETSALRRGDIDEIKRLIAEREGRR